MEQPSFDSWVKSMLKLRLVLLQNVRYDKSPLNRGGSIFRPTPNDEQYFEILVHIDDISISRYRSTLDIDDLSILIYCPPLDIDDIYCPPLDRGEGGKLLDSSMGESWLGESCRVSGEQTGIHLKTSWEPFPKEDQTF